MKIKFYLRKIRVHFRNFIFAVSHCNDVIFVYNENKLLARTVEDRNILIDRLKKSVRTKQITIKKLDGVIEHLTRQLESDPFKKELENTVMRLQEELKRERPRDAEQAIKDIIDTYGTDEEKIAEIIVDTIENIL